MLSSDVIREVSSDLNDQEPGHEYVRWTVAQLQSYLREALIDVGANLHDLFFEKVVVRVQPGAGWQEACDCNSIVRIVGETDPRGRVIRYLSRSLDIEENTWAGPVERCYIHPKDYAMTGYTVSAVDDKEFRVFPPVPPGVSKYVLIECYHRPKGDDLNENVPDEAVAMVKQWMLYRALSVDSENNPTIIELANNHRATFFNLLQAAMLRRAMERTDGNSVRAVQNTSSD